MKFILSILLLVISIESRAQIHTNPGGGPDPYNDKRVIPECPEIDPIVFILQDSFIKDYKLKNKVPDTNFFELVEKMSLEELIKQFPIVSKGIITLSCSAEEKDSLMQIYQMYKYAADNDKRCAFYLTVTTNKLKVLEDVLKINGKK